MKKNNYYKKIFTVFSTFIITSLISTSFVYANLDNTYSKKFILSNNTQCNLKNNNNTNTKCNTRQNYKLNKCNDCNNKDCQRNNCNKNTSTRNNKKYLNKQCNNCTQNKR